MQFVVRPTALGLKGAFFYALLAMAFFAAPYTNLFFLLLSCLSVMAVTGAFWSLRNIRRANAEVLSVAPAPAGIGHDVLVQLSPTRGTGFQVAVCVRVDGRWHTIAEVPRLHEPVVVSARLPGMNRGVHSITAAQIRSHYPFGILRWSRPIAAPTEVVAFPAPLELPNAADRGALVAALCGHQAVPGGDVNPAGLRPFRTGDTLRAVQWKASARRNDLIVLEREGDGADGWEVVLDRRSQEPEFERSLSLVAALALLARDQKERFSLASQGLAATFGSSETPISQCLKWLAEADRLPTSAAAPPPSSPTVLHLPRDLLDPDQRAARGVSRA